MAAGFFNLGPMPKAEKPKVQSKFIGCERCGLDQKGKDAPFWGEGKEGILILGEAPRGSSELSEPFSHNKYGILWDMEGKRFSKDILRDCSLGFAVPCPIGNDTLDSARSQCCKGRLMAHVRAMKPRVIVAMGPVAMQALVWDRMSGRISGTQATDFIGHAIPDRELNCWIIPTYSPDFIAWKDRDKAPILYFQQHLRRAWSLRAEPLPEIPKNILITRDAGQAESWVRLALAEAKEVAIDYETTGIKPHREGHQIVIASVAWERPNGELVSYGFQWFSEHRGLVDAWAELMTAPGIGKIAHKADFEAGWTRFRTGFKYSKGPWIHPLSWDTCLAAHCINNNGKVGLKFQTYANLGVLGYDTNIDRYLSGLLPGEDPESNNAFNHLKSKQLPWDDLIHYCAEDSIYTLWLKQRQVHELEPSQMKGFNLFLAGVMTLSKIHENGIPFSMEAAKKAKAELTTRIDEAVRKIMSSPEVKRWTKGAFSPSSNPQLQELLYDILKIDPPGGARNVQEATLSKIGTPFTDAILEQRRLTKLRDTFLAGFIREAVWDTERNCFLVRPFFNLSSGADDGTGGPKTFRSSSDSPNFQNIPKRDKEALKLVRNLFQAPPGWKFKEYDYKGVEVSGSACHHRDPNMIKYLTDPTTDMHRDTAMDMFFRTLKTFTKAERQGAKNGYVFPTFYGATPASMAPHMWEDMAPETRQHLAEVGEVTYWDKETKKEVKVKGIKTLAQFSEHVKNVDRKFWGVRFKVYGKWRDEEWARYQKDGYLEYLTGFRCYGPMEFTEATNRRIQGSSFHILLQSLIWEVADIEASGIQAMIMGQIHDAKICLVHEDAEKALDSIIYRNGCERIRKEWSWIIVPLTIEHEASAPGDTWANMKSLGALTAPVVD
jgi:DNA polymerase I-like protein with 3'-5' exonuclease and polymerase domains/uracil-DNA glycosylase